MAWRIGSLGMWLYKLRGLNGPNFTWPLLMFSGAISEKNLQRMGKIYAGKPMKVKTRKEGTEMARAAVDDGRALEKLRLWVEASEGQMGVFELIVGAASREDKVQQMQHPLKLGQSAV